MTTILCISSYLKGHEFIREAKRLGCRVLLLTVEKLKDEDWPMESIDERYLMPDLFNREHMLDALSYLARSEAIDRIVALDEFDLEMASAVREHLRTPGMGETTVRYFRDKLAMRMQAQENGILVPEFVALTNHARIEEYAARVPAPWILKPRTSASAIGMRKIANRDELWYLLDELGNRQSHHLLERFVPGDVMHVDSVVWNREVVFAEANGYLAPPFDVYHGGGMFASRSIERGSAVEAELKAMNHRISGALGMVRGVLHTEFIRAHEDGRIHFLETAARVGGAHIVEMVEMATGINLWREWARVEVCDARGEAYVLPHTRQEYGGLILSLARQEWPDLGAYDDAEIRMRIHKRHHAGLILASPSRERVHDLLASYMTRFREEFLAVMPAATTATD